MCHTFKEYTSCLTCNKSWNPERQMVSCIKQYCYTTYKPRQAPSMVNHDTCLTCKIAVQQRWRDTLDEQKKALDEQNSMLQIPKQAKLKLTPLFWNTNKGKFDDIWAKEDPTIGTACGATKALLQSLVCHRESRFKELWKKQAQSGR